LLEAEPDLEVVTVCETFDELLEAVAAEQPDVVITDIRMPPTNLDEGIRAAEQFRETSPELGAIVLSQYVEPGYAHALFSSGTERRAYLLKEALVGAKKQSDQSPLHELTPRELDVLREMAEGKNNASIAASLFLTERSVEKVIHSILRKLGLGWDASVHKRVKAVILYLADPEMGAEALRRSPDTVT
jgi:DNA-binding NarL/FixJ family response regulator